MNSNSVVYHVISVIRIPYFEENIIGTAKSKIMIIPMETPRNYESGERDKKSFFKKIERCFHSVYVGLRFEEKISPLCFKAYNGES